MKVRKTRLGLGLLATACFMATAVQAENVKLAPDRLVLNALGNADAVQANVGMSLAGPVNIVDFDVVLYFEDIEVARAEDVRYCYIDDMLLVDFDRYSVLTNPDVIDLAGQTVLATVEGWILVDTGSSTYVRKFSGTDLADIVAPGNRR